jgi:hypothetical protein
MPSSTAGSGGGSHGNTSAAVTGAASGTTGSAIAPEPGGSINLDPEERPGVCGDGVLDDD